MNKKIALTIEQMKYLEELGLDTSDASLIYAKVNTYHLIANDDDKKEDEYYACTLQDILEIILPIKLGDKKYFIVNPDYGVCIIKDHDYEPSTTENYFDGDLLESAYKALVWCIENNYIKTNKV